MSDSLQYISAGGEGFKGKALDELLAAGFYRMQHLMFTCNETTTSDEWRTIPVFWLRTLINNCKLANSAKNILRKCAGFSVVIQNAEADEEINVLYELYKNHVLFQAANSVADYLHQPILDDPFNSMMIKVYDMNRLIAAGYFDKGETTIAGIMNIYHPGYHSYSLGKFLILQKLQYALSEKMQFYYTGYISTESTRFDYKTFPDANAVEVLLPLQQMWVPYVILGKAFLAEYYAKLLA